jgi:hypothetical protein
MKQGYVIARNRARKEFFTSSSAYDRPVWTPLAEATVYITPEMAQNAAVKLAIRGSYEARMLSLAEALTIDDLKAASARGNPMDRESNIEMELPSDSDVVGDDPGMEVDVQPDGEGGMEMTAADQQEACEKCMKCPCACDSEDTDTDVSDMVDDQVAGGEMPGDNLVGDEMDDMGDEMSGLDPNRPRMESVEAAGTTQHASVLAKKLVSTKDNLKKARAAGDEKAVKTLSAKINNLSQAMSNMTGVGESATMPAKPLPDGKPADNKTTAADLPAVPVIKYTDAANVTDKPDTDLTTSGAMDHGEKVKVPAEVMSHLKTAISDFQKCADLSDSRDDAKGSFCMTVVSAFEELRDLLEVGTVESVKQAQIKMTSWMNPITSHLPVSVQKFIFMGGRKPTLKDMFDDKRLQKRASA